ncbi:MAG: GNAT family N-acetyltransferase [Candidatus Omnitrophica bacterium]|nr:GNAT family N-acetyltransferase [Candidatus Omnitrophota bacterium]
MIAIRRFAEEDQKAVKDLVVKIMNQEFREDMAAYPTDDLDDVSKTYGGISEAFFVAVDGDRVVGTVAIKKEDDRVALLRRLFVDTPYRNQRIGMRLIDRALQFCSEVGYGEVVFRTTSRMEGAIQLCRKCGFSPRAKLQLGSFELLKFSLSIAAWAKKNA